MFDEPEEPRFVTYEKYEREVEELKDEILHLCDENFNYQQQIEELEQKLKELKNENQNSRTFSFRGFKRKRTSEK